MKFYTVAEVAAIMRSSTRTVRRHIKAGDFPNYTRPGKFYLIPEEDLKKLLQETLGRREDE